MLDGQEWAKWLRVEMAARGWHPEDVAVKVRVSARTVSRWMAGAPPSRLGKAAVERVLGGSK